MSENNTNREYLENLKALIAGENESMSYIDRLKAKVGRQEEEHENN